MREWDKSTYAKDRTKGPITHQGHFSDVFIPNYQKDRITSPISLIFMSNNISNFVSNPKIFFLFLRIFIPNMEHKNKGWRILTEEKRKPGQAHSLHTSCRIEIIAIFVFPAPVGAQTCRHFKILSKKASS